MSEPTIESIQAALDARVKAMTPAQAYEVVEAALSDLDNTTETWSELDIVARWLKNMASDEYMVKHYHEQ